MLNYRRERADTDQISRDSLSVELATEQIARAVKKQWNREELSRRILDPSPLLVRWTNAPEELFDHWSNILRMQPIGRIRPLDLTGRLDTIVETFHRIPSKRLIVLGGAGSGKTILAIRFTLDFIARREPGDPIPVIFTVAPWDPTKESLEDWLADRLIESYPALAASVPNFHSIAAELINDGHILPVLDGFDEIAEKLQRAALRRLNATTLPLILTSRQAEYASAVGKTDILTAAAAVVLSGLTIDDLSEYLPRTTRKAGIKKYRPITKWDLVITKLRMPSTREEQVAATVLSVPLMVGLARAIYSDNKDRDPGELLQRGLFTTPDALERHLLGDFIPAVYQYPPNFLQHRSPGNAQHWLESLARNLKNLNTYDIRWWQLRDTMPLPIRMFFGLLVGAIGGGFLLWPLWKSGIGLGLGSGFGLGVAMIRKSRRPIRTALRFSGQKVRVIEFSLSGAAGGIAGGELTGLLAGSNGFAIKFLAESVSGSFGMISGVGFAIGLAIGFSFVGVSFFRLAGTGTDIPGAKNQNRDWLFLPLKSAAIGFLAGLLGGSALGLTCGLILGAAGGFSAGLAIGLEAAVDIDSSPSPLDLLRADRNNALFLMLLFGLTAGLSIGAAAWLAIGPIRGLMLGVGSGLVDGLGIALGYTAWGQWLIFTRCGLSLTRQLPPSLPTFLADAYQRGILRQAGAVYQFRHRRLQDYLCDVTRLHIDLLIFNGGCYWLL
jgi:hypothetical protein